MGQVALLIKAVLITFCSAKFSQAASCTPVNYARFRDLLSEGTSSSLFGTRHPGRFFTTAYMFGCHGVITEWAAYTVNNGSHPIEFHVWRADETLSNVYHLVGINVFQNAQPDANRLISFQVPPEEQIIVSPGDFVGIRTVEQAGSSEPGFAIQFDGGNPGTHRRYFPTNESSFPTPTILDLRLPHTNFSSIELMDNFGASIPVIRATVFEFGSNTTTVTTSSSSEPQSTTQSVPAPVLPQSVIIAIAVSGSVLVLAIVMMIVATLMCCLLCNRKRKTTTTNQAHVVGNGNGNRPSATQAHLMNNPAYNVENTSNRLVSNPAYSSDQLTNNPAYNYHDGNTEPYYTVIRD